MMSPVPPPIVTQALQIVDAQGRPRLLLSAISGAPTLRLLRNDGAAGATVCLDAAGRPSVQLVNPAPAGPTASLEIDDKGAHVKFDRPGGASSYLFLNNAGGSGVVLIDPRGVRRLTVVIANDGGLAIQTFGPDGTPLP